MTFLTSLQDPARIYFNTPQGFCLGSFKDRTLYPCRILQGFLTIFKDFAKDPSRTEVALHPCRILQGFLKHHKDFIKDPSRMRTLHPCRILEGFSKDLKDFIKDPSRIRALHPCRILQGSSKILKDFVKDPSRTESLKESARIFVKILTVPARILSFKDPDRILTHPYGSLRIL